MEHETSNEIREYRKYWKAADNNIMSSLLAKPTSNISWKSN